MKKAIIVGTALILCSPAFASIKGFLINSEYVSTVTGTMAWKCTYTVAGQNAVVMSKEMCPQSMDFQ